MITRSYSHFLSIAEEIQDYKSSYIRINEILSIPKETQGKLEVDSIKNIELKDIKFSYGEKLIFSEFSYNFQANNIYVVMGENGSGKSTLINLILGLYIDEYEGTIEYNGSKIQDIDLFKLR